jgi:hypothetical protein
MMRSGYHLLTTEDIAQCVCGKPRWREKYAGVDVPLDCFVCDNCGFGVFTHTDDGAVAFRDEIAKQHA